MGTLVSMGTKTDFLSAFEEISTSEKSSYVCFVNAHMCVTAQKEADFADVVNQADIACSDGRPIAWSLRLLYHIPQVQLAGPDMVYDLLKIADHSHKRFFLLGSTPEVQTSFVRRADNDFPNAVFCGKSSPPFRSLTIEEDDELVRKINDSKADMIFVSLGCPKQERWMADHKGRVDGAMFGIGYAVPVYAGFATRAPRFICACGFEWLYRLLQDPFRLAKRYFVTNSIFLASVLKNTLFGRK